MSTIKTDAITAVSTNTDISVDGDGTGVPDLGAGMKVGGSVGIPVSELRTGTDGELITWDASGNPTTVAVGTSTHVLTSNGVGAAPTFQAAGGGFTLGTEQSTTSGSSVTFSGIPAGTTMIVIMFEDVSLNLNGPIDVTIGDSGGLETSGYVSESNLSTASGGGDFRTSTSAFLITNSGAGDKMGGMMILTLKDSTNFTWTEHVLGRLGTTLLAHGGGHKSLSAELTQVSISSGTGNQGSTNFDSGSINIMYQ